MATGRVCGVEALVRWQHPTYGLLPLGQFIPLAEHTGRIKPLTEWMVEMVLALNAEWATQGCAVPIAVNLSARSLHDESFLRMLQRLLGQYDGAAGMPELEVTESSLMEDAEQALSILHSLRAMGIALYIDDFGTGYSSLSYLQKLPVNCIKIDQSFVQSMCADKDAAVMCVRRSTSCTTLVVKPLPKASKRRRLGTSLLGFAATSPRAIS